MLSGCINQTHGAEETNAPFLIKSEKKLHRALFHKTKSMYFSVEKDDIALTVTKRIVLCTLSTCLLVALPHSIFSSPESL